MLVARTPREVVASAQAKNAPTASAIAAPAKQATTANSTSSWPATSFFDSPSTFALVRSQTSPANAATEPLMTTKRTSSSLD